MRGVIVGAHYPKNPDLYGGFERGITITSHPYFNEKDVEVYDCVRHTFGGSDDGTIEPNTLHTYYLTDQPTIQADAAEASCDQREQTTTMHQTTITVTQRVIEHKYAIGETLYYEGHERGTITGIGVYKPESSDWPVYLLDGATDPGRGLVIEGIDVTAAARWSSSPPMPEPMPEHKFNVGDTLYMRPEDDYPHFTIAAIEHNQYGWCYISTDGRPYQIGRENGSNADWHTRPPKPEGFPKGSTVLFGERQRTVASDVEWEHGVYVQRFAYPEYPEAAPFTETVDWAMEHYTLQVKPTPREFRTTVYRQLLASGPEHFDMGHWYRIDGDNKDLPAVLRIERFDVNDCGTSACLAGHCAIAARKAGIELHEKGEYVTTSDLIQPLGELLGIEARAGAWGSFDTSPSAWHPVQRAVFYTSIDSGEDRKTAEWRAALSLLQYLGVDDALPS